jgi:hypothetical protein
MDDEALYAALRSVLVVGIGDVAVRQDYQPSTQGRQAGNALYMHIVTVKRYGWRKSVDDAFGVHTETQLIETGVQITAYDPRDDGYPGDIAALAIDLLQSDEGLAQLRAAGLKPLRVTDVRPPFFTNDREQFEGSPNFDIMVEHESTRVYDVPDALPVAGIYPI